MATLGRRGKLWSLGIHEVSWFLTWELLEVKSGGHLDTKASTFWPNIAKYKGGYESKSEYHQLGGLRLRCTLCQIHFCWLTCHIWWFLAECLLVITLKNIVAQIPILHSVVEIHFFGELHMLILCLFTFFSAELHPVYKPLFFYWNQFSLVKVFYLPFCWLGEQPQFTRVTTKLGKQPANKISFIFFQFGIQYFSFLGPEPHRLESDSYTPGVQSPSRWYFPLNHPEIPFTSIPSRINPTLANSLKFPNPTLAIKSLWYPITIY